MHFDEDREAFILKNGQEFSDYALLSGGYPHIIRQALIEGSASEVNYQKAKQDQNEILKLRAELEASEAILSLWRDAGMQLANKIDSNPPGVTWLIRSERLRNIIALTPVSVGEEFNAMRSVLMQARAAMWHLNFEDLNKAQKRITEILGC